MHCHSVYSDGSCTVEQILRYATRAGLSHIALSDHDTMAGVRELTTLAGDALCVIPAVECTCTDFPRNRPVHLLCYFPQETAELLQLLNHTLANRRLAKLEMVEKLGRLYPISKEDVMELSHGSASIHETHLIQALAHMGYTATVCGELMQSLIGKRGSCYVPVPYPDVWEMVSVIRRSGGLCVLAHPGQFESLPLARELCAENLLDGIECHHPRNNAQTTQSTLALAARHGLIVTGGTDFHGMYTSTPNPIGSYTTDSVNLQAMFVRVGKSKRT